MEWSFKEDLKVCAFYFAYKEKWRAHINELVECFKHQKEYRKFMQGEFYDARYDKNENALAMRVSNYQFRNGGNGLPNYPEQVNEAYNFIVEAFIHEHISTEELLIFMNDVDIEF